MQQGLKEKTITGMIWSTVQKFGALLISFVANLVLARLLTPEDFGYIGMITVFIAVANTLVDGGFASALIQKKKPTNIDYSTIFYWNIILSVLFYIAIYLAAPSIAEFYKQPLLETILRIQGLVLFFNAFTIIQSNQLIKQLNFKKLAKLNLISTSLGSIVGIVMAFQGYGVWSLVAKLLITSLTQSILLWFFNSWRPLKIFSYESFKSLFKFGFLMLLSTLVETIYTNIQALIIGRAYSAKDLGFYSQADKLQKLPANSLSGIVNQVTYPVFAEMQNDLPRMKNGVKKSLKSVTYLNFPIMVLLIIIANPLLNLLLTDKWSESIPYFQILCLSGMLLTLNTTNTNIFKAIGRSDIYFFTQLGKRLLGLGLIFIGLQFGIKGMLYGIVCSSYLFFIINAYISGRNIQYGIVEQIKDIAPSYLISIVTGVLTYIFTYSINLNNVLLIFIQICMYSVLYLGISYFFKIEAFYIYYKTFKKIINKTEQ